MIFWWRACGFLCRVCAKHRMVTRRLCWPLRRTALTVCVRCWTAVPTWMSSAMYVSPHVDEAITFFLVFFCRDFLWYLWYFSDSNFSWYLSWAMLCLFAAYEFSVETLARAKNVASHACFRVHTMSDSHFYHLKCMLSDADQLINVSVSGVRGGSLNARTNDRPGALRLVSPLRAVI